MNLQEFLTETLVQLVEGIEGAQKRMVDAGTKGVGLNTPISGPTSELKKFGMVNASGHGAQLIQFNIAITATEGTGTKGGIGVVAGVLSLGSSGQSHAENATVSRVKFTSGFADKSSYRGLALSAAAFRSKNSMLALVSPNFLGQI